MSARSHPPPRVVLDTNVCLDLLHFGDPRCATLQLALDRGAVEAVTDTACREEWCRVLTYPQLRIDERTRPALEARFDALIALVHEAERQRRPDIGLPRCEDPDDQKFLELVRDTRATALVTKDRALLRLWRRCARSAGFAIVPPELLRHQALGDPQFWITMRGGEVRR